MMMGADAPFQHPLPWPQRHELASATAQGLRKRAARRSERLAAARAMRAAHGNTSAAWDGEVDAAMAEPSVPTAICPVPGCTMEQRAESMEEACADLATHLRRHHTPAQYTAISNATLAGWGIWRCQAAGCGVPFAVACLPGRTRGPWHAHLTEKKLNSAPHAALLEGKGEATVRNEAIAVIVQVAPPGSFGASLKVPKSGVRHGGVAPALPRPLGHHTDAARTVRSGTVRPADFPFADLDQFDLNEIRNAPHMSFVRLTCVTDVIADEIVQLWIYGRDAMLQQCENATGLHGFKYAVITHAIVLGYARGTPRPADAALRERAMRCAANEPHVLAQWSQRLEESRAARRADLACDKQRQLAVVAQTLMYKASAALRHVEQGADGKAKGAFGAAPVLPATKPHVQQMAVDLLPQGQLPSPTVWAAEPGVAPFQANTKSYEEFCQHLPDGKGAGTLRYPYEMIKVAVRAGGLEVERGLANACYAGKFHRDVAFALAYGKLMMLLKMITAAGVERGRPILMPEADRRCWGGYLCKTDAALHAEHFTKISPERKQRWLQGVHEATQRMERCRVAEADAYGTRDEAAIELARRRHDQAAKALGEASRPPKFPVNLGIGVHGGAEIAHHIARARSERNPLKAQVMDDIKNYFPTSKREAQADATRLAFPQYLPFFGTFSMHASPVHLGPEVGVLHIEMVEGELYRLREADWGMNLAAADLDASMVADMTAAGAHRVLAAVVGDFQGDPPSPLKCSISYQRQLNRVQDKCSDMDITAFVDDTMLQGATPSLPTDYATKRTICKDGCDAESETLKATVYSREASDAELARFGPDIMGSPLHPEGRVLCVKYLGGYIGDGPTCARKTAERLKQATAVLTQLEALRDEARTPLAVWAKYRVARVAVSTTAIYSLRITPPFISSAPATSFDEALTASAIDTFEMRASPQYRANLAILQVFLDVKFGGFGYFKAAVRDGGTVSGLMACYAASIFKYWADACVLAPDLATEVLATSDLPMLRAARDAYAAFPKTRAAVATRHADISKVVYWDLFLRKHHAFHPRMLPSAAAVPELAAILSGEAKAPRQSVLMKVVQCEAWLQWYDAAVMMDATWMAGSEHPRRETTRVVSCSQSFAGAVWDSTARAAPRSLASKHMLPAMQYRLGLYLSASAEAYDALAAAGTRVTAAMRLGDAMATKGDHHGPHNAALEQWVQARRATSAGSVIMGDKGDGRRTAHKWNDTCVADIIETAGPRLTEIKSWNVVKSSYAAGTRGGDRDNGHQFSMGNTEESAFRKTLGAPARGDAATDGVFNHETGEGAISGVDWEPAGRRLRPDYRDAILRGTPVDVVVHETGSSAFNQVGVNLLQRGAREIKAPGGHDGTDYSTSNVRGSYVVHWARRISAAITVAFGEHLAEQAKGVAREAGRAAQGAPIRPTLADWMPRAATAPPMPQLTLPAPQEPIPDTPPPRPRQVAPSRPPTGGTMPMEVGTPQSPPPPPARDEDDAAAWRRRVVHHRNDFNGAADYAYIGRASHGSPPNCACSWGNTAGAVPSWCYRASDEERDAEHRILVRRHRAAILRRPDEVVRARRELAGKRLGCWCAPRFACHGDTLAELANCSLRHLVRVVRDAGLEAMWREWAATPGETDAVAMAVRGAFRGGGEGGTIPMEVDTPTSTSTTTQAAATPGTSRTLIPSTSPIQQGPDPGLSTCVTDVSGSSSRSGRSGARGRAQGGRGRGGHEREQQRRGRGSGPPVVRPEAMVRGRGDRVGARAEARARQLSAGSGTCPGRCVATAERSGGPVGN